MVQRMQDRSAVNSKFRASIAPVLERLVAALQDKFSQAAEVTPTGPAVAVLELLSQVLRHVDLRKANLHQVSKERQSEVYAFHLTVVCSWSA